MKPWEEAKSPYSQEDDLLNLGHLSDEDYELLHIKELGCLTYKELERYLKILNKRIINVSTRDREFLKKIDKAQENKLRKAYMYAKRNLDIKYLLEARKRDPESIWTKRAEKLFDNSVTIPKEESNYVPITQEILDKLEKNKNKDKRLIALHKRIKKQKFISKELLKCLLAESTT